MTITGMYLFSLKDDMELTSVTSLDFTDSVTTAEEKRTSESSGEVTETYSTAEEEMMSSVTESESTTAEDLTNAAKTSTKMDQDVCDLFTVSTKEQQQQPQQKRKNGFQRFFSWMRKNIFSCVADVEEADKGRTRWRSGKVFAL